MKYSFDRIAFYCSIAFAALMMTFIYGFVVHRTGIFPYKFVYNAAYAAKAIYEVYFVDDPDVKGIDFIDANFSQPTVNHFSIEEGEESLLIVSNEFAHKELNASGCFAWLMDRNGKTLHAWKNRPEIQELLQSGQSLRSLAASRVYPVGAYLYPNGDLLVSYQGKNVFPIARGMVKFDKDSNILWLKQKYLHHWFDVDKQGNIYVPGTKIVESPLKISDSCKYFVCLKGKFTYDTVVILNSEGNIIDEIDLFDAIVDSGLAGVFHNSGLSYSKIYTCDPMHLNDIRIISTAHAANCDLLNPGDLLLSFRSLNAVGVLDPESRVFKWFHVGASHCQHSPRLLRDGRILTFDNLGGRRSMGTTRVASVKIPDGEWGLIFPKEGVELPPRSFYSATAGHIDIHPNEARMLVSWTHSGLVWEIDIRSGKVLWEYINTHPQADGEIGRLSVYTALYAYNASFKMNGGVFNSN